jgi:PAS domain S-box-containing protein
LGVLGLVARFDFLAFHLVAELFSVIAGLLVFTTAIGSYRLHRNTYLLVLGCAYFWVGGLDLAHTLTYQGMGLFGVTSANLATQLWLVARALEAASLLIAPFYLLRFRPLSPLKVMAVFAWLSAVLVSLIASGLMPEAYVDGRGLTPFKVISEWAIIVTLIAALGHMIYRRTLIPRPSYGPMVAALLLTITTELLFTLYVGVHGVINLVGHLLKFMSSWLVLEALVSSTLTRPFEMVARATDSFDGIPDPVLLINRHGLLVQINRATRQWMGKDLDAIVGRPLIDALHLDLDDDNTLFIQQAISTLSPLHDHEAVDTRRQRTILLSMAPFWNSHKDAIMVVSLRDITERQAMERALSVAKQRAEMALVNSGQGLWDWNIKTGAVFFSPAIETMLGYQPGTWDRSISAWERLLHPDDLPQVMRDLSRHLEGETPLYDNTHRLRHKDGHWVWVRDRGKVVERDDKGAPARAVGTHSDVSSAVARETHLSSVNAKLQSFAYELSHDLKEPLETLAQQLQLLQKTRGDALNGEPSVVLKHACDGALRLNTMIDELLECTRIESATITLVPVDMNVLCSNVIRALQRTLLEHDGQVSCGPSLPLVLGDLDILDQVLHTLLINALTGHATGRPPKVSINGWNEADRAVFEVTDHGLDLDPQDCQTLFEIYRRSPDNAGFPSHRIGLAVVKHSLDRLGGSISVRSEPGQGSTFRVTLKLPPGPASAMAQAVAASHQDQEEV